MEFKELVNRAKEIRDKYAELEIKVAGKPWGARERTEAFLADAGDLMKLVMAKNGYRQIDDLDHKLKHELSDCLWAILMIADELNIDMESEFGKSLDEEERRIKEILENK
jgi:NTP pyrophosphatase (non-canonical NTP hydrolase)